MEMKITNDDAFPVHGSLSMGVNIKRNIFISLPLFTRLGIESKSTNIRRITPIQAISDYEARLITMHYIDLCSLYEMICCWCF